MAAKAKKTQKKKGAAKKGRVISAKTKKASTAESANASPKVLDVRSPESVKLLEDLIKKNKVVLVLVYADWCGHCKTFKKDIWNKLAKMPNRKVPLAQVNDRMVSQTPLSSAKIEGYPSVVPIGSDMKPATFKNDAGETTNAMPNTRDAKMMESLVTQDPEIVLKDTPGSKPLTEEAEKAGAEAAGTAPLASTPSPSAAAAAAATDSADTKFTNPPNLEEDFMSSGVQATPPSQTTTQPLPSAPRPVAVGGSLFQDLVNFAKGGGGPLSPGQTRKRRQDQRRSTRRA
jgi:thiol-disulfide isomerase/thioredoxin